MSPGPNLKPPMTAAPPLAEQAEAFAARLLERAQQIEEQDPDASHDWYEARNCILDLLDAFRALAQGGGEDTKRLDWLNDQPPPVIIAIGRRFRDYEAITEDADIRECIDIAISAARPDTRSGTHALTTDGDRQRASESERLALSRQEPATGIGRGDEPAAAEPARPSLHEMYEAWLKGREVGRREMTRVLADPPPRYDEIFAEGQQQLHEAALPPSAAPSADRYDKDWSEHEGQLAPTEVVAHRPEPPELTPAHREELTKLHRVADNSPSCNWCRMPYPCDTTRLLAQVSALEQRLLRPTTEPPELEPVLREFVEYCRGVARHQHEPEWNDRADAIERLGRERAGALDEAAHWKRCWDAECVRLREANESLDRSYDAWTNVQSLYQQTRVRLREANERAERAAPLMFLLREQDTGPSAAASALSELQKGSIIDMLLNTFDEVRQLRADRAALVKTLESISRWDMPPTPDGKPYVYHWGSSGERDVIVQRARVALAEYDAARTQESDDAEG